MKLSCAKGLKKRRLLYAAAFGVLLLILVLAHHILYQNKGVDRGEMSAPTDMFTSENSSEPTEASHEMIQAWDGNVSRLQKLTVHIRQELFLYWHSSMTRYIAIM